MNIHYYTLHLLGISIMMNEYTLHFFIVRLPECFFWLYVVATTSTVDPAAPRGAISTSPVVEEQRRLSQAKRPKSRASHGGLMCGKNMDSIEKHRETTSEIFEKIWKTMGTSLKRSITYVI